MTSAQSIAMQALSVSRALMLFVPYTLAICAGFFLLKGGTAPEVRNRVTIFTAALVIGMLLCTFWLAVNSSPGRVISYAGALLTRGLLWLIGAICGALMIHALVYMLSSMRELPGLLRNRIACLVILVAIPVALYTIVPQARYWSHFYSADNCRLAIETARARHQDTDDFTREWAAQSPADWHALLLRANFLRETGRTAEARLLYGTMLALPETEVPEPVRDWTGRLARQLHRETVYAP